MVELARTSALNITGPHPLSSFPATRLRRTRHAEWSRRLVQETHLTVNDLIWPLFVTSGNKVRQPIPSLPGVERLSIDLILEAVKQAEDLGIPAVALFPYTDPALRRPDGREGLNPDNLVCRATRAIKAAKPNVGVILDVALDPYTSHGHDGLMRDGEIDNDATLDVLAQQALIQAQAGADVLAPSDMMDGRIAAVREVLEDGNHTNTQILSYAAKYASAFYGPFRDAVGSGGVLKGDKRTYQMNPANAREALREVELDINEGADMVMVKPGGPYLDIVALIASTFDVPTLAYQTSGEYAMIEAAAQNDWIDGEAAMMESLLAFKRAGASAIFTYYAPKVARLLATA